MRMKQAPAAVTTVRGFHTPAASGDEESDCSGLNTLRLNTSSPDKRNGLSMSNLNSQNNQNPPNSNNLNAQSKLNLVSNSSCAMMRSDSNRSVASPTISGISKLRSELSKLNLNDTISRSQSFVNHVKGHLKRGSSGSNTGDTTPEKSDIDSSDDTTYEVSLGGGGGYDYIANGSFPTWDEDDNIVFRSSVNVSEEKHKMTAADFEPLRCLGKGAFGTVHLVRQVSTGRLFAQKQFKKASLIVHKSQIEQTKTERAILESVDRHPFVVKLYYAFQDQAKLYLILEYAQGGELFHHMQLERFFTQEHAAFYMAELVLALEHLHKNLGVVYRDLKPENCLLDADGHLLLTDFGLSKVAVDGESCGTIAGTVEYMAPEVVQGKKYGFAVDWWSLGALGFDLMTGNPPFRGNNKNIIMQNIVHGKLKMPYHFSAETKDLLTRLLRKEPKKRLGSGPRDLQTIKSHRFFRNVDWKALARRDAEPPIVPFINDPELAENFSAEFTELPLSPVVERGMWGAKEDLSPANPFGGFSYVASRSLLDGFSGHGRGHSADAASLFEQEVGGEVEESARPRADSVNSMASF